MADENAEAVDDEDGEGEGKKGGSMMMFIIIGAVVVLLVGGGAGAFFMGFLDPLLGVEEQLAEGEEAPPPPPPPSFYYELPEQTVNLYAQNSRAQYLKVKISLELESDAIVAEIERNMPRVLDAFQTYMRELRPSDLEGTKGVFHLKEQLLLRINQAVYPAEVRAILFEDFLVQ